MKKQILKMLVIGTFELVAAPASATGFVSLPAAGFSISGGTSAYTLCNTTGNFGFGSPLKPTTTANNECAVFTATEVTAPVAGFTLITSASRSAVMNNSYTGNINKTFGVVTEYVWRNTAQTQCIYGAKVVLNNTDYQTSSGTQYFKITDFSRSGFSGLDISAGYSTIQTSAQPVYRIGRTFTAVQYANTSGYVALPSTTPAFSQSINGVNGSGTPLASQQSASLNDNWVTFRTNIFYPTSAASSIFHVQANCTSAAPVAVPNAIRLRQTATPFIEIPVTGFVPPGGTALPNPVTPY